MAPTLPTSPLHSPASIQSDSSTQTISIQSTSTSMTPSNSSGGSSDASSSQTCPSSPLTSPSASFRSFSFTRPPNSYYYSPTSSHLNLSSPDSHSNDSSVSSSPRLIPPPLTAAADRFSTSRPTLSTSTSTSPPLPSTTTPGRRRSLAPPPLVCSSPPATRPSIALSTNEPDFSFKTQPSAHARQPKNTSNSTAAAPRGKLLVKLISARHLSPPSIQSRPYVVVTFDQNEFVSREPIHEEGEEVTGLARPVALTPAGGGGGGETTTIENGQGQGGSKSPIPDLKGRLPLPATPGGGLNPGEKGYEEQVEAERDQEKREAQLSSTQLSRSPASGLGRKLEEYGTINNSSNNNNNGSTTGTKPPKLELDVNVPVPTARPDEAKTPTGASDEPTNGLLGGDAEMAYNPTWKHEVYFDVMNEKSPLVLQIYDRSIEEECFLGFAELRPKLINNHTIDQWFALQARPGEDHAVTGEIRIQIRYEKYDVKRGLSVNDFDFLRMIGKGTFGRVFQVRKKDTKRIYAMKVLSKREIVAKKEIAHTIGERKILQRSSDSPFLLGLKFSFQTEQDLYLIMDYKSGGELFHHLQKEGRFTEDRARFYTAEIVLAFEHLHKFDIVYRDLKPENILLDATGHIVLCDFGLSKPDLPSDALTNTFCGTTEYLAPEVLLDDNGYSKIVDFWSLGVLLFEMCCGWSPFYAEDTQQMYKLICFGKVKFPRGVIGEDGKQFVKGLLNRNPKHRLGATRDAEELKEHAFFKNIDWELLAQRAVPPPFKPYVDSDESVANFDPEFTEANLMDEAPHDVEFDESDPSPNWLDKASELGRSQAEKASPMEIRNNASRSTRPPVQPLTNSVQENFRGFTFSGEDHSMINQANRSFAGLAMTDASSADLPSRRSSGSSEPSMKQVEDEWEDER
ncbi:uncharacterized protein JCM6883_003778 [Sporobolomyces salmoneus]|uniref:uncharacterized protein n=1 Tax=Sporobolomyces salmoneus TaxID=183962 RepID=UPI003171DCA1